MFHKHLASALRSPPQTESEKGWSGTFQDAMSWCTRPGEKSSKPQSSAISTHLQQCPSTRTPLSCPRSWRPCIFKMPLKRLLYMRSAMRISVFLSQAALSDFLLQSRRPHLSSSKTVGWADVGIGGYSKAWLRQQTPEDSRGWLEGCCPSCSWWSPLPGWKTGTFRPFFHPSTLQTHWEHRHTATRLRLVRFVSRGILKGSTTPPWDAPWWEHTRAHTHILPPSQLKGRWLVLEEDSRRRAQAGVRKINLGSPVSSSYL